MGVVYLAEDTILHRNAVLKFLLPQYLAEPELNARLLREARAAAALNHPNIITIYEVGEARNQIFIAMEYVEGESLRDLLARQELTLNEVFDLAGQICEGLAEAHRAGIVHRDLKPSNILLNKAGRVKIADFGLARLEGVPKLTAEGALMGTPNYMSPEQAESLPLDQRSDIFSLGVILYELITRRLPFRGRDTRAVLRAITEQEPEPLARYKAGVSDGLQRLINRALAKDVETRYQHVEDLLADLKYEKKILFKPAPSMPKRVEPTMTIPVPPKIEKRAEEKAPNLRPPQPRDEKTSKRRRPIAFGVIAGLGLVLLAWWVVSKFGESPSAPAKTPLSITTTPSRATVFLNNDSIGVTPLQFATELVGTIKLRLQKRDYFALDTAVVITKGRDEKFAFTLKPMARVSISVTPPDAEVIVDGQIIPSSRLSRLELSKGQHTIAISKTGYVPLVEEFDLNPGSNPARSYNLKANPPPGMELIPAGSFMMGSDDGDSDEKPVHQVYVDAFYMDKSEVTVAQYQQFISATRRAISEQWAEQLQNPNRPVVYVSWNDAVAYAKWKGKRLPTEAEWEYAARGGYTGVGGKSKYKFPWGNEESHDQANYSGTGGKDQWQDTSPVGSFPPNGFGLYDMAGNVWEWCSSLYQPYPYKSDDGRENATASGVRVLRGRAWSSNQSSGRCADRYGSGPSFRVDHVGFRCVQDVR